MHNEVSVMKNYKVRIVQPNVGQYRVALYESLGRIFGENLEVLATDGAGTPNVSQPLRGVKYDYSHPIKRIGPIGWQVGLSLGGMGRGDVLVICGEIQTLSNLWLAFCAKIKRVAVVWWGHHRSATSTESRTRVRLWIAKKLSDVFLCYTKTGADFLVERGFAKNRVFATWNTIDQQPIKSAIQWWNCDRLSSFKVNNNLEGRSLLLVCSALRVKTCLDLLLYAIADERLVKRGLLLAVIGDGPKGKEWRRLASELGVNDSILWLGAMRDQMELAPWFLSASIYIYPGAVGLGILHSLSFGLPVLVHGNADHQMPEYEVMENGRTGFTFKEGSVEDLADKIEYCVDHPEEVDSMRGYCKLKAYTQYSMENMVKNFSAAIECAHEQIK